MLKRRETINKTDKTLRFMRCFEECVQSLTNNKQFPLAASYQRSKVYFKLEDSSPSTHDSNIYLFDTPINENEAYFNTLNNFEYLNSDHAIDKHIIEYIVTNGCIRINNLGKWVLVTKIKVFILF
jgi:hypothetical protein